jgi:hypothetical protein
LQKPHGVTSQKTPFFIFTAVKTSNLTRIGRRCGLVVRVPGCRNRGPGFDSRHYQLFVVSVGLEWDPLSLVRINENIHEITIPPV